jgi:DNA topoisomerase-1
MRIAQSLYEGKDLGSLGTVGLITYMRTDSTRVSREAVEAAREHVEKTFGKECLPDKPRAFRQKKDSQDAHEAIRPTSMQLPPEKLASVLNRDELRLYTLIWNRFIASQMAQAEFDVTKVDIRAGDALLRATGQVLRFAGWLKQYGEEEKDDESASNGNETPQASLPDLKEGEALEALDISAQQSFTQPPPRYSEAMLVRALEENGIGRPSTYASILSVLADRDYVDKIEGRFKPTDVGELVVDLMIKHFGDIFEIAYTARMEQELDQVEEGDKSGVDTLRQFATMFRKDLEKARLEMENVKRRQIRTDIDCDKCGSKMVRRWGRFGEFLACEKYPDCKNTRDLDANNEPMPEVDERCPKCEREMTLRRGRWGPFLACTGYPECKTTRKIKIKEGQIEVKRDIPLDETCPECGKHLAKKSGRYGEYVACSAYPECRFVKQDLVGVDCPKCGKQIASRRSRRGRTFYGCTGYPDCDFVSWKKPVAKACPDCGAAYLVESITKRHGHRLLCDSKDCSYQEQVDDGPSSDDRAKAGTS